MRSSWYVLGGDLMITLEGLICRAKWGLKCPEAHHTIEHGNVERSAWSALTGPASIFQEPNRREAPSLTRRPHTRHSIRSDLPQETQRTDFLMIHWRTVTLDGQTLYWYTLMIRPWSYFSKNAHGIHQICVSKLGLLEFDIWTKLYHIANTICPLSGDILSGKGGWFAVRQRGQLAV